MIKAVVFDLDDTLYDYTSCNKHAEQQLFEAIGKEFGVTQDQARDYLKNAKRYVKERLGDNVAASHNRLLYMQSICEQTGRNPLKHAMNFYNIYWDDMLECMKPYEYVKPLMDQLREKNIKIGILTDMTAQIQYRKIERLGLTDYIDCIVTSEEAGAEKPSEKMFLLMLEKLRVRPYEALMVGDSEVKDIKGAKAVGMETINYGEVLDSSSLLQ